MSLLSCLIELTLFYVAFSRSKTTTVGSNQGLPYELFFSEPGTKKVIPGGGKPYHDYMEEKPQAAQVYYDDMETMRLITAPPKKKKCSEHLNDFLKVIQEYSGENIYYLIAAYIDSDAFLNGWNFIKLKDLSGILKELRQMSEFAALIDYAESGNCNYTYYIRRFDEYIDEVENPRHVYTKTSGNDFNSFCKDLLGLLPREQLGLLFEKKMSRDSQFRTAFMDFYSEDFEVIYERLRRNRSFDSELRSIIPSGIDLYQILVLLKCVIGLCS